MLNAIEPGTVMPVHRHLKSSETVVCVRGHFEEYFYDENGVLTDTVDMMPGGVVLNVPIGVWHSLRSLESGTVLLECKDRKWEPLGMLIWLDCKSACCNRCCLCTIGGHEKYIYICTLVL